MTSNINGLVLCGGKSTRMGRDKSEISYHGKSQRDYLTTILKPFCTQVFISAPTGTKQTETTIPDHFALDSPLNGILSAFHFDPLAAWLIVAVDMPNIDSTAVEYLIKNRDGHKTATCFLDSDGENPEPLFTIWEPKAKPLLFDFFNHGEVSPKKFLLENDVLVIKAPSLNWLINVNTEGELAQYLKHS